MSTLPHQHLFDEFQQAAGAMTPENRATCSLFCLPPIATGGGILIGTVVSMANFGFSTGIFGSTLFAGTLSGVSSFSYQLVNCALKGNLQDWQQHTLTVSSFALGLLTAMGTAHLFGLMVAMPILVETTLIIAATKLLLS